jgi:hypothetical protein
MSAAPADKPDSTPFERMQALATRVLSVPKSEVDKREREWREQRTATAQKKREARR